MGAVKSRRRGHLCRHNHLSRAASPTESARHLKYRTPSGEEALIQLCLSTKTFKEKKDDCTMQRCQHHSQHISQPQSQAVMCLCSGDRSAGIRDCSNTDVGYYTNSLRSSSQPSKMLYTHLNLDTHPVVTRLQNEQNLRLEGMEQRMNKIRRSAQQEAERRKFAHLFRAHSQDKTHVEEMLKEASKALELLKKEKDERMACEQRLISADVDHIELPSETEPQCDRGDIIPVHVLSEAADGNGKGMLSELQPAQPLQWLLQPIETFSLNGIMLWLVLPFLLPVLLVLHLVRHFSSGRDTSGHKKSL